MPSDTLGDSLMKSRPNQHWARPRFLHYSCLYDYMNSSYDDVIDYLNKKQRGINCEPPRAQSWAERAVRIQMKPRRELTPIRWELYTDPATRTLMNTAHWTTSYHTVHSNNWYYRKYRSIL